LQILDHNRDNPEDKIKFPTAIDLHKWLVALVKPECPWYYEVSFCAPQYALRQLASTWKRAFKKTSKPPRFKKKGRGDSFTLDGSIELDHFKIRVPVIGWLRTYERLPVCSQPKSVTISRTADRTPAAGASHWSLSFKLEYEPVNRPKPHPVVGVDLGIKALAVLSTGIVVEGAKSYRKIELKLSRLQWLNRHKQIGMAAPRCASRPETPTHVVRGSDTTGWVLLDAFVSRDNRRSLKNFRDC